MKDEGGSGNQDQGGTVGDFDGSKLKFFSKSSVSKMLNIKKRFCELDSDAKLVFVVGN